MQHNKYTGVNITDINDNKITALRLMMTKKHFSTDIHPDGIQIWGIWRQHHEPYMNFLQCGRSINLLDEATDIREYCCHEGY